MADKSNQTRPATTSPATTGRDDSPVQSEPGVQPVPRLPRGKGFALAGPQIVRIVMFVALLVGVIFLRQPCADGIAGFMGQFEPSLDAASAPQNASQNQPVPDDELPPGVVRITGDMSDDEVVRKLQQAGLGLSEPAPSAGGADDAGPARDIRQ
ncbi:MAG: hypothetical protein MJE77_10580 [Proteobacteria bacterium]|nr:hypothetical protein [Pseudomonadota bacterium]